MTANQLLQVLAEVLYIIIFLSVTIQAIRQPRRVRFDKALFFGASALIIIESRLVMALGLEPDPLRQAFNSSILMALPYLLLRLVDDFAGVPRSLLRGAELGLLLTILSLFFINPLPLPLALLMVVYFVGLQLYAAAVFIRAAGKSSGVTRRRMQAVAVGSLFLGLNIAAAGFQAALPALRDLWLSLGTLLGMASGVAYFVGFAPPRWLRRAWQEPELRLFLSRAAHLPRLPDTVSIVRELEQGAAQSLGAPMASVGLWDGDMERLVFRVDNQFAPLPDGPWQAQKVFDTQRTVFVEDVVRENPLLREQYKQFGVKALLGAPITAGTRRLGVLLVSSPRAPIFADSDLDLMQLLADQAAVVLESRALIDEAARVRAREEATRLKDDFLSAAAHDLRTPLTTIFAQAQLLERLTLRSPDAPTDLNGIRRIVRESRRLDRLVRELLDVSRIEQGKLLGIREPVDIIEIAERVCADLTSERHDCRVEADEPVVGLYDAARIMQLLENLMENAVKYSPSGGEVRIKVWREDGEARIAVIDRGIGIPPTDLPNLFDRYHRGTNVDDRRFAGMGLGLFICRGIAEQHGGRIWATSAGAGQGSTFHVALPLAVEELQNA